MFALPSRCARLRVAPPAARWLCRRCLPVVCAPTPALGCVALAHARSRRKSDALEGWDRMRPLGRWSYARPGEPGSRQPEQYASELGLFQIPAQPGFAMVSDVEIAHTAVIGVAD